VSRADYPYPEDEFDAAANPDAPRGVHRAPRSAWSRWWPFLVVIVVAPVLAYGLVSWAARTGDLPALGSGLTSGTQDGAQEPGDDGASDEATDGATDGAVPPEGTDDGEPTDGASEPPADTPPPPEPVLSTPVTVLNGAGINGLAARTAEKLTAADFTAVDTGNVTGARPQVSTVFYGTAELQTTAELVASTLGLTTVTLSQAEAGEGVTVVLVSDPDA